jgi:DNA-binding response OmpR family regulator
MPGLDGIGLLRRLRGDARFCALPVVMLTASGEVGDGELAVEAGADAYLTKPASSDEVIATVGRLLEAR